MKQISIISIIATVAVVVYLFFEPFLIYNLGWKVFPNTESLNLNKKHQCTVTKKADSLLKVIYAELKTPAVSIAVGKQGKVAWVNSVGFADIQKRIVVDADTKFRIGSTSKAVTSLGIGVLLDRQKLNLASKIKDFVPYAKDRVSELTMEQLASHSSGIRNYGACWCFPIWEYYNNKSYESVRESIQVFGDDALLFEPGTHFSYSTYNYTLLSAMIEGSSNLSFPEFMLQEVYTPLGIENIIAENSDVAHGKVAKFYDVRDQEYKEVYKVNNSNKWAGGGLLATPKDLIILGNAFLNQKLLTKETTKILTTPVLLKNGEVNEQNYALGWRSDFTTEVFNDDRNVKIWHHAGTANGATSLLILFPDYDISISILVNRSDSVSDLFTFSYMFAHLFSTQTM